MSPPYKPTPGQPQGGPPPRIKRKATRAQREAARRNALKSTGPRDTSRTRLNGLKHGQCSTLDATLPGESRDEINNKVHLYITQLGTKGEAERDQARAAALAMVRHDRGIIEAERPVLLAQEAQQFKLELDAARVSADDACMRRHRYIRENLRASQTARGELRRLQMLRLEHGGTLGINSPDQAAGSQARDQGSEMVEACQQGAAETAPEAPRRSEAGAAEVDIRPGACEPLSPPPGDASGGPGAVVAPPVAPHSADTSPPPGPAPASG